MAIGSHDLVLDLAASALRERDPRLTLVSSNVGSLGGLVALRDGLCHVAGSHLLDPATGEYTLPYLDRVLGPGAGVVIRLVHRQQGLLVAPGNPLGLAGVADLARPGVRYVNRQRGAGTRVLLDHELARRGIDPVDVDGYRREESTHLAVAAAVASGRADAGLGILAAARAFGLDFVPVADEPYDLVTTAADPGRRASSTRCSTCSPTPPSRPRSRRSAATPPPRPAAGSGRKGGHEHPVPRADRAGGLAHRGAGRLPRLLPVRPAGQGRRAVRRTSCAAASCPSGWSPLELVKHLTYVELRWLEWGFEGRPVDDPWGDHDGDRWQVDGRRDRRERSPRLSPGAAR